MIQDLRAAKASDTAPAPTQAGPATAMGAGITQSEAEDAAPPTSERSPQSVSPKAELGMNAAASE